MVGFSKYVYNKVRAFPTEKRAKLFLHKTLQNIFNIQVPMLHSFWWCLKQCQKYLVWNAIKSAKWSTLKLSKFTQWTQWRTYYHCLHTTVIPYIHRTAAFQGWLLFLYCQLRIIVVLSKEHNSKTGNDANIIHNTL